eukprot:TRINITY_DN7910_c0_g7_i2.p1 TRINITY_DN7910_c0_g7~~TRINITY_DN7910_c0_g7_i2.p1  ORF type:complete len:208 (-),score=39.98 TRINITY_DN7910_c0_g7_i2:49-672(-)
MMDHHCPWTANCIGYNNYKYFFLTLVYTATVYIYYTIAAMYASFVHPEPSTILPGYFFAAQMVIWIIYSLANAPMVIMCFGHISLLCWSSTSVESIKGAMLSQTCFNACCPGEDSASVFQLGVLNYVRRIMGKWTFLWFLPVNFSHRAGFEFGGRPTSILETREKKLMLSKPLDPEKYMEKITAKIKKRIGDRPLIYEDIAAINSVH